MSVELVGSGSGDCESALADTFNSQLPAALGKLGIRQFIPNRNPQWIKEGDKNIASIHYYHDELLHEIVYSNWPKYVMMPTAPLAEQLEKLYKSHGLNGWHDPRVTAAVAATFPEKAQTE